MNSQTKIVVIPMKELIIGAVIAVIILAVAILAVFTFGGTNATSTSGASNNSYYSSKNSGSGSNSNTNENTSSAKTSASASANVANTYTPGVYTSSITLNGNPVDIQVTVDGNNINSIEIKNLSDSITTMYPMLQTSFNELASKVIANGSTQNITYSADNKYTSTMLLNAIQNALDKCTIR